MTRTDWCEHPLRPLAPQDFQQIRELAYQSFGLDLKPGKEELVTARLQRLVRHGGFHSYQEYCRHVRNDSTGESLLALIDALTTNHTSFLREPEHFEFLRSNLLPRLRRRETVAVWSAACSTGEELWTLAFLLHEVLAAAHIQLIGSDISRKALARSQAATYSAERVSVLPATWVQAYLTAEGHPPAYYRVKPAIRAEASFRRLNLVKPFSWPIPFPIVFCRNVMIYFDRPMQQRVVTGLEASLEPGGYLFIGHAESLTGIDHHLEYVRPAVYRKPVGRRGGAWNALR